MRQFFLPAVAVLALVGGADAQQPLPSPFKIEPLRPSPFARPGTLPALGIGKGSEVLKGLDLSPFDKPLAKPPLVWPKLSMPEAFDPDRPAIGPGSTILARSRLFDPEALLGQPPAVRPMDTAKFPAERRWVLGLKDRFPKLGADFEVLGAGTPDPDTCAARAGTRQAIPGTYNCIAHTAGIKNVWVNPYQTGAGWDDYYGPLGYKRAAGTDTSFTTGTQKVAVYATKRPDGQLKQYTHAAVQDADGTWTSKLGSGPLIRHRTAEAVGGGLYGEVVRVYERRR